MRFGQFRSVRVAVAGLAVAASLSLGAALPVAAGCGSSCDHAVSGLVQHDGSWVDYNNWHTMTYSTGPFAGVSTWPAWPFSVRLYLSVTGDPQVAYNVNDTNYKRLASISYGGSFTTSAKEDHNCSCSQTDTWYGIYNY